MKLQIIFVYSFLFILLANNFQIFSLLNQVCGIPVILHSNKVMSLGYDNCNMNTNGESLITNYLIKPLDKVFDVGANKGDWSKMVLKQHPVTIYAFEPITEIFAHLKERLTPTEANVYNIALSDYNGTKVFYQYPIEQTFQKDT